MGWLVPAAPDAATLVVTSTADQRARNKPPPPGSLREALVRASPGDTIVFQVGVPIVLLTRLQVRAELTGITIRGPVEIAATAKLGAVDVLADGATVQGLTFRNVQVTLGTSGFETAGARLLENTFLGDSGVDVRQVEDCLVEGNTFALGVLDLIGTNRCRIVGNRFTQGTDDQIVDSNSLDLVIEGRNELSGTMTVEPRSGRITANTVSGDRGIQVRPSKPPFGLLRIDGNTAPRIEVSRTNLEVVDNTIATVRGGGGETLSLLRVVNTKGPGTVLVERNTMTGGKIGLFYTENKKSVPAVLRQNVVSDCSDRGIVVSGGVGVQIERNEVRNCGPGPMSAGLHIVKPKGDDVVAERNVIESIQGAGIDVTGPDGDVTLRRNEVRGSTLAGIAIGKGKGRILAEDNIVVGNGQTGIFVWSKANAAIVGGEIGGNGGAGVAVGVKATVAISETSFHDNAGAGIDLAPPAVTENPVKKLANGDLDWPENLSFVNGILEGDAAPGGRVEVFRVEPGARVANPENGEGITFVASTVANAGGHWQVGVPCEPGTLLTTTATLPGDQPPTAPEARTSEFSKDVTCTAPGLDTDGDGVPDTSDAFPLDPGETTDTDLDGTGNNADPDDDGDLQIDAHEVACGSDPLNAASTAPDADGDHVPDCVDEGALDSDGDGIPDAIDIYCPESPAGQIVNEVGCETSEAAPGGMTCHCNEELTCGLDAQNGGACTTCVCVDHENVTFDCSKDTSPSTVCTVHADGTAGCGNDCTFDAPNASADCAGGRCERPVGGTFVCDGQAGGCATTIKSTGATTRCPATEGCRTAIDHEVYRSIMLSDAATIVLRKRTIDGMGQPGPDDLFRFALSFPGTEPFTDRILTENGSGSYALHLKRADDTPVDVEELVPAGWELTALTCDAQHQVVGDATLRLVDLQPRDIAVCTFTNRKLPPAGAVRALPGLDAPEAADAAGSFGLPPGNRITIGGVNGFLVIDALTDVVPTAGTRLLSFIQLGARTVGALVVKHPLGNDSDAIFAYGQNGRTTQFFPEDGDFGFTQISPFGNLTDGVHMGGDPAAPAVLWVDHTGSGTVGARVWRDFGTGELIFSGATVPLVGGSLHLPGASGSVVSAFAYETLKFDPDGTLAADATGWVAAVTVGTPGELWLRNPATTATGTKIGAVGTEPRRLRCLPSANRCVVSNFGSDSLTIVQWDGLGTASILGTVPVGDGPVGIDLRADGTGVAVISTGFNDDTYTVTKLAADGSVTSNVSTAAPAGCTDPGHGLWLDGTAGTIVLTCNGSDAYAVITP